MSYAIIEHDGKKYLALDVSPRIEGVDGVDVCVIEVNASVVARWRSQCSLFDQVRVEMDADVSHLGFIDISPEWREANFEADPVDDDGEISPPVWSAGASRTEGDMLEISEMTMEWTCRPKHYDGPEVVGASLWRSDLEEIAAKVCT